jgi:HEAT repeat protein
VPFFAAVGDVTAQVDERLSAEPEALYDHLLEIVTWVADAPMDASWRVRFFSRLEDVLLSPSQYPALRERAVSALVASRSREIIDVFRQAARAQEPLSRMLAVLGLGAVGSPDLLPDVVAMLSDVDPSVQIAAALALGAIGGEMATEHMVDLLFEGSELVRQAVAESLAADAEVGYQLLLEAMGEQDMLVRRATVFGLARVGEPWALEILTERQTADDQWFVRDAAHDALQNMASDRRSPKLFLAPEEMDWLLDWAANRGEGVPHGPRAVEVLIRALQDGNDDVRYTAADTLGKIGGLESVPPLYAALRDPSPLVRETAYRALVSLSQAMGRPLPAVL